MLASCYQLAGALAPPALGFPAAGLDHLGWFCESPSQMAAALGGLAVGPGAFHKRSSGMGVPSWGERALLASLTGAIGRREHPQELHQCSWGITTGQGAQGGAQGDGPRALPAPERLQGFAPRVQTPGVPVLVALLVEPLAAFRVFGDRTDIFLAHDVLCRRRADDLREPPELGRAPRRPAGVADIVSEPEGLEAQLGVLPIAAGICTGAGEIAPGFIGPGGDIHARESPRAGQPCQWHSLSAVGVDAVTSLFGPQRRCHAPAGIGFFRQRALQPIAPRPSLIEKEEGCSLGLHLADEWVEVTLTGPHSPEGGHVRAMRWGARRHGNGVLVDVHSDKQGASLRHG